MLGILTLHYGFNEGAILQAYALAQLLSAQVDDDVRIIDHRYPDKVRIYSRNMDPRKQALGAAVDFWLPVTSERFVTDDAYMTWRYISDRCSGLIIGSDQVWRTFYRRFLFGIICRQPSRFIGAFPNVYWPPEWVQVPKCAYAASVGDNLSAPPPRRHLQIMRNVFADLRVIGVRDERTASFVETVAPQCAERIRVCPDPTILFPWKYGDAFSSLAEKARRVGLNIAKPFWLLAMDACDYAHKLARIIRAGGWLVVGYGSGDTYSDISLARVGITPLEWVALIGKATFCVTDRYHAFIFSVLQKRPCLVFDRALSERRDSLTRILSLANSIGYGRYVLKMGSPTEDVFRMAQTMHPDWHTIDGGLERLREVGRHVIEEICQALNT